jgi:hypothetical protein
MFQELLLLINGSSKLVLVEWNSECDTTRDQVVVNWGV